MKNALWSLPKQIRQHVSRWIIWLMVSVCTITSTTWWNLLCDQQDGTSVKVWKWSIRFYTLSKVLNNLILINLHILGLLLVSLVTCTSIWLTLIGCCFIDLLFTRNTWRAISWYFTWGRTDAEHRWCWWW